MRNYINLNKDWQFSDGVNTETVSVPHTWNAIDGADGGNDYVRAKRTYTKTFARPKGKVVYLEVKGANSSASVYVNGLFATVHHGGFSTFRVDITDLLKDENELKIEVDNIATEKVYPQTADFTFFGGIYRDVNLIVLDEASYFDPDFCGSQGLKVTSSVENGVGKVRLEANIVGAGQAQAHYYIYDGETLVAENDTGVFEIENPHLWDGLKDPHMYSAKATLTLCGKVADEITALFGLRYFSVDKDKGFFLNGRSYPLRGVCRHQDRKGKGYAIGKAEHDEDMQIILEIGANTIRLAHYQHDDYFYDLCDKYGLVVWAEIPYISRHMPEANANAESQMKELITQEYNHPSIVTWGVSNEITMFNKHRKDMLEEHVKLNDMCHQMDPSRLTTLACYAACGPTNKVGKITDLVSWNLYLGWYVPFFFLNDGWFWLYRVLNPKRIIGMSEYGAEGMPNLHSVSPRRGDNTEEYQCKYHEYMLKFFARNPYLWATHVWNMYDFAADARNQGGEPGMNHKGLVTYDRKTRKDAFYLYKAYWSEEKFIHLCGKRFVNRTGGKLNIKVYTNEPTVELYVDDKLVKTQNGDKVFNFSVPFKGTTKITVKAGDLTDEATFNKVATKDRSYILTKTDTKNWQK